ncbi:MAG: MFS transporter [Chloroflexi bacterium]|nr:MFS transporter [Chloroflexota bacterium]MBU1746730.1 MFS transporter [Chloroflexota bacterium]
MVNDSNSAQPTQSMRSFLVIWTGQAFSLLGSHLVQFALVWWLTVTTGSATVLAFASLVALLPQILIGPFAGALVDRWNRRMVMMVADSAIALVTVLLAVLYGLGVVQVWHIYVLLFIRALGGAFHWPAMQASTTLLVPREHLSRVGGLNLTLSGLANILIPPLGALALEALPMQAILAIDVVTAVPAVAALFFVSIPQPVRQEIAGTSGTKPSVLADMREGFRFVWNWKGLMLFSVIGTLSNLLGRAAASLSPIVVIEHFAGGALELGLLQSAVGVGAVLGGVTLGVWGGGKRRIMTAMLALALDGIAITVFGLTPTSAFPLAVVAISMVGFLETMLMGINGAIFQAVVPPEMQGRVFSLLISAAQVATPLGLAIAGPVADVLGAQSWWLIAGTVITAMGVGAFFVPAIMQIENRTSP